MTLDGLAGVRRISPRTSARCSTRVARSGPVPTDPRTLDGIADGSAHLLSVAQGYEAVLDLGDAFTAARRVLAPNGVLAFHLNPGRVRAGRASHG